MTFVQTPIHWPGYLGRMGVLLFFVHTALVLMQSLERHGTKRGWVRRFYLRRFFRIYPLPAVCLTAALLFQIPYAPLALFTARSTVEVASNYLLVQNFIPEHHSILGPAWSLPYEVQMYLLLPGIFAFIAFRSGWQRWAAFGAVVAASLALARLNYTWPKGLPELMSFFPCFIGGVVAWYLLKLVSPFLPSLTWLPALIASSFAYVHWAAPRNDGRFQWLLCLLLGCLIPTFRRVSNPWLIRASEQIAKYSYGIYLAHDPLLWALFVKLQFGPVLGAVAFAVLLPSVVFTLYHLVEQPMIAVGAALTRVEAKTTPKTAAKLRAAA